jgi:hypothetical protein
MYTHTSLLYTIWIYKCVWTTSGRLWAVGYAGQAQEQNDSHHSTGWVRSLMSWLRRGPGGMWWKNIDQVHIKAHTSTQDKCLPSLLNPARSGLSGHKLHVVWVLRCIWCSALTVWEDSTGSLETNLDWETSLQLLPWPWRLLKLTWQEESCLVFGRLSNIQISVGFCYWCFVLQSI